MYLTARSAVADDLPSIFVFLGERLQVPAADRKDMIRMWSQVMAEADYSAPLVEDTDREEGKRAVGFNFKFSVPEELMNYARTESPPFLWRWQLARWRKRQVFWQEKKEARRLQAEGDGAYFFGFAGADTIRCSGVELEKVIDMLSSSVTKEASRFHVRYFVTEAYGVTQRERLSFYGMKPLRDYKEQKYSLELKGLSKEQRPFMMAADFRQAAKDESLKDTAVGKASRLGPPKFGFSEPEQEVMKMALLGLTDQVIAEKLGLTLVAIKKRWEGIYEKVNERAYLRAWERSGSDDGSVKIGRRQVLQMVGEHPEEFWPSNSRRRIAPGKLKGS